jgi:hypothetical protein
MVYPISKHRPSLINNKRVRSKGKISHVISKERGVITVELPHGDGRDGDGAREPAGVVLGQHPEQGGNMLPNNVILLT